jgi:uncharacterized protein
MGVLTRKFDKNREQVARVAVLLTDIAEVVVPTSRGRALTDEPDNRILECARAAGAEAIITGDQAMLALGSYKSTKIMTLNDYLALT